MLNRFTSFWPKQVRGQHYAQYARVKIRMLAADTPWRRNASSTVMQKVNQFAFYKFGAALRDLNEVKEGDTFLQFCMPFLSVSTPLRKFIDENLHVSLPL